jgi:hypothetical protein
MREYWELAGIKAMQDSHAVWNIWGVSDQGCVKCGAGAFLLVKDSGTAFPGDFAVGCSSCGSVSDLIDLALAHQHLIEDRFREVSRGGLSAAIRRTHALVANLVAKAPTTSKPRASNAVAGNGSMKVQEDNETAVPDGYRNVSWIRLYEARAVQEAFNQKRTIEVSDQQSRLVFRAEYFGDDTAEARKWKSNVCAVRIRKSGNSRTIGWIRREEARAVIQADEEKTSIEFRHVHAGNGGLVEYFEPTSATAQKYLSSTRLLRRI